MRRSFEKISFEQFKKDVADDKELYSNFRLPERKTKASAGYDFHSIVDFVLKPGDVLKVPTGVKVSMLRDEALMLFVRSSMGFKYNIRLCNQVGVIESDYYNNEKNEGHIWVALENHGKKDLTIKQGDCFVQGVFTKFLIVDDEDTESLMIRKGGFGSTSKEVVE